MAASLGLPARYARLIPILFARCESLGSTPARAVELLRAGAIGDNSRVLELACGKGSASVAIASALGARVRGIDADASFIAAARSLATREHVSSRCRFTCADVRALPLPRTRADAALMIGWLGHERAAPLLRRLVKPGGLYLFDDAIPREAGTPRAVVRSFVESLGDRVVAADLIPARELARRVAADTALVGEGLARAIAHHPRLERGLRRWFEGFRAAGRTLSAEFRTGVWLARRSG